MTISIITINYNNLEGFKKTMQSVFEQSYQAYEYIVIDGGSTDGSKEYIESHQNKLTYWVSEPDQGIYHAMNKGIDHANGDYLLFLNSGDWLANKIVLETFLGFDPIEDIVYGDVYERLDGRWQRKYMPETMTIGVALTHSLAHQAQFFKDRLFKEGLRYDVTYKCSGDRSLTNDAFIFRNATTRYVDLVVCYFDDPGISSDLKLRYAERKRYLNSNFDKPFISLLKDYQRLQKDHHNLTNNRLVKVAIWALKKRNQLNGYFKKLS